MAPHHFLGAAAVSLALHLALTVYFGARAILRPGRTPASRAAWLAVLVAAPYVGALAYALIGDTRIGAARRAREKQIRAKTNAMPQAPDAPIGELPERFAALFRLGGAVEGFRACGGNRIEVTRDSDEAIARMVEALDAAREHAHLCFYIWLTDSNGRAMIEATIRAARRGVACRVLVDALGSRDLVASPLWRRMGEAGVETRLALPIGVPFTRLMAGRIDLRVHRKNVVIDHEIAFLGSQNCADAAFRIKAKYAPWVDIWLRVEGPVAHSCQRLFVEDWSVAGGADLTDLLLGPIAPRPDGAPAQVIGAGPTTHGADMSDAFVAAMFTARRELIVTTPYFVPDEPIEAALRGAALRGVAVTLIVPARVDSRFVALAGRSYYGSLLAAGVAVFEFGKGMLHAKTLTVDGEAALVGSANLDRRSLQLNYENNLLFVSPAVTAAVRERQLGWLADARRVGAQEVEDWSVGRRLAQNAAAIMGPLL